VPRNVGNNWDDLGYNSGFHSDDPDAYYDITSLDTADPEPANQCPADVVNALPGNPSVCYKYEVKSAYINYVRNCGTEADEWELCALAPECCESTWACSTMSPPGFSNNCNDTACADRAAWDTCDPDIAAVFGCKTCDELTNADCIDRDERYTQCLITAGSACRECFQEILGPDGDPALRYSFVARSGEEAVIIWQIHSSSAAVSQDIPTYFYSLVRVEDSNADVVHESLVHQKSFQGAFTVYAATHIPNGVLQQGGSYTVKIYYFIPDIDSLGVVSGIDLSILVDSIDIILVRVRE
jgi:hypothetical protein